MLYSIKLRPSLRRIQSILPVLVAFSIVIAPTGCGPRKSHQNGSGQPTGAQNRLSNAQQTLGQLGQTNDVSGGGLQVLGVESDEATGDVETPWAIPTVSYTHFNNDTFLALIKKIYMESTTGNFSISPFALKTALANLLAATDETVTAPVQQNAMSNALTARNILGLLGADVQAEGFQLPQSKAMMLGQIRALKQELNSLSVDPSVYKSLLSVAGANLNRSFVSAVESAFDVVFRPTPNEGIFNDLINRMSGRPDLEIVSERDVSGSQVAILSGAITTTRWLKSFAESTTDEPFRSFNNPRSVDIKYLVRENLSEKAISLHCQLPRDAMTNHSYQACVPHAFAEAPARGFVRINVLALPLVSDSQPSPQTMAYFILSEDGDPDNISAGIRLTDVATSKSFWEIIDQNIQAVQLKEIKIPKVTHMDEQPISESSGMTVVNPATQDFAQRPQSLLRSILLLGEYDRLVDNVQGSPLGALLNVSGLNIRKEGKEPSANVPVPADAPSLIANRPFVLVVRHETSKEMISFNNITKVDAQ